MFPHSSMLAGLLWSIWGAVPRILITLQHPNVRIFRSIWDTLLIVSTAAILYEGGSVCWARISVGGFREWGPVSDRWRRLDKWKVAFQEIIILMMQSETIYRHKEVVRRPDDGKMTAISPVLYQFPIIKVTKQYVMFMESRWCRFISIWIFLT